MKILFLTPGRSARGGHIVLTNIVRGLRADGYDIDVVVFEGKDHDTQISFWHDIDVKIIKLPHRDDPDQYRMSAVETASAFFRENHELYDRIIVDSWFNALAVVRTGLVSDKVFHLVQSDPVFTPESADLFWKAELFNILPYTPMNRIVVSQSLASHFEKTYNTRFHSMPLFVDKNYLHTDFAVRDSEVLKLVTSSATFDLETKGLDFLLEQLNHFNAFQFELMIISGKPIEKNLTHCKFPIRVEQAMNVGEMVDLLGENDIYVNTSTSEAFCLALAEALAIGMPAIALDSIGNREYMDGENAIFVQDARNFSQELAKLQKIESRIGFSKRAKESMQEYTLENTLRIFKQITNIRI